MQTFRKLAMFALLAPAGCTSMSGAVGGGERILGVVHSTCGVTDGGAVHLALDTGKEFVIVNADSGWGRGGTNGWTLQKDQLSQDFTVQVCADGSGCETPMEGHFAIESGNDKEITGTISYRTSGGAKQFRFRAVRTDVNGPIQYCG